MHGCSSRQGRQAEGLEGCGSRWSVGLCRGPRPGANPEGGGSGCPCHRPNAHVAPPVCQAPQEVLGAAVKKLEAQAAPTWSPTPGSSEDGHRECGPGGGRSSFQHLGTPCNAGQSGATLGAGFVLDTRVCCYALGVTLALDLGASHPQLPPLPWPLLSGCLASEAKASARGWGSLQALPCTAGCRVPTPGQSGHRPAEMAFPAPLVPSPGSGFAQ